MLRTALSPMLRGGVRTLRTMRRRCDVLRYDCVPELPCCAFNHANLHPWLPRTAIYLPRYSTAPRTQESPSEEEPEGKPETNAEPEKLSLVQRYKKMLKEYWYVLLPVHAVTSLAWFGSFYYAATMGLDIVPFLEKIGVGETILKSLRSSSLGYLAVASALYKIATPARYGVTIGVSTVAVKYLSKRGVIKPMPSRKQIKSIIQQKRDSIMKEKKEQS